MAEMAKTKVAEEMKHLKVAASFTEWSSTKLIQEIENCIDGEVATKNSQIAAKIEKQLDIPEKIGKFLQKYQVESADLIDYPLPVIVQSAEVKNKNEGVFNLNKVTI